MQIGFHASHEQWPPSRLLTLVRQAEQAGFDAAMCSDHLFPWLPEQGHSGHAWCWLGAAMQATRLSLGTVCAPGQRYHPVVVAQAAATLAETFPGRFWLAVGSGEALNEHVTGEPWPEKSQRNARLRECVEIMRRLWAGQRVEHRGLVTAQAAQLYSLPAEPPPIIGAALSSDTARWMGSWTDGLITAGSDAESLARLIDAYREGGGEGKPVMLQLAISLAATEEQARYEAHREWRQCVLDGQQLSDLASPEQFALATAAATVDDVARLLRVSADIRQHVAWLHEYRELGFDALYVHQVGRDMDRFFDAFATEVLPALVA